jgi:CheY-like chemotaxis protein
MYSAIESHAVVAPARAQGSVLCVDDNPVIAELLKLSLIEIPGLTASFATCGGDALKMARKQPPNLVLLDLFLPDLTGLEVMAAMRADPKLCAVPVVIITGSTHVDDVRQCLAAGACEVWHKPLSMTWLAARLPDFMPRRQPAPVPVLA